MNLSEAQLQTMVLELARTLGLQAYHTHDSRRSQPGFPDLVIVGAKGVLFRELKTMTGKITADQQYWISILRTAGMDACVWRPDDWPDAISREMRALGRVTIPPPPRKPARIPTQRSRSW